MLPSFFINKRSVDTRGKSKLKWVETKFLIIGDGCKLNKILNFES